MGRESQARTCSEREARAAERAPERLQVARGHGVVRRMAVAHVVGRMHAACGAVRLRQGRAGLRQRAALVAAEAVDR